MHLWQAVMGCLLAYAHGHHLTASTMETLVVAKSKDANPELQVSTTEKSKVTTEAPLPPIKLTEMEVTSSVSLRYAHTLVVAHVKNPAKRAQEANFRVLLPETAFISGFVMTLGNESYKAYVKGKEEAKQIYETAVSQGIGAAHVQSKARDSNQFVVSVNVEASSSAVFNLTYEELLVRRNGVYNHAVNLHPGALVPKLSVTVHIKEAHKITDLRVPQIRTGNEIDATKDDAQNSMAVIERAHDDREATVRFTPNLEEQKKLMEIYTDKAKESANKTEDHNDNIPLGIIGQFVIQYDVERPKDGEILVNNGYFVHFFAPTDLTTLPKFVVFVLDTSGSMSGRKIEQLREAMQTILSDLNPEDYFNVVEFSTYVSVHDLKEADKEPPQNQSYYMSPNSIRTPPSPATAENIAKAQVIVSRLVATDNTNIAAALDIAIDIVRKRTTWSKHDSLITSTEGRHNKSTLAEQSKDADRFDVEKMKALEPIIIFLTDGRPTVDILDPTAIINRVTEKIKLTEEKITIFSLAFGSSADGKLLRKLSLRNFGFMRHIYEAADAALQLRDFYRQISSPLLADVQFKYPDEQVQESSVTKNCFKHYFAGSELVVAGKVSSEASEVSAQINAFCKTLSAKGSYNRVRCVSTPKERVPSTIMESLPLERLWSYLTIKQLLDQIDASDDNDKEDRKKKALDLALKYEFVTPFTSLVVVKPNVSVAVNPESFEPARTSFKLFRSRTRSRTKSRVVIAPLSDPSSDSSTTDTSISSPSEDSGYNYPSSSSWTPASGTGTDDADGPSPALSRSQQSTLRRYHLQEYPWTVTMVNTYEHLLELNLGGYVLSYKLTEEAQGPIVPESPKASACADAAGDDIRRCVYLTHCEPAKHITVLQYNKLHCSFYGFAGVCCSEKDIVNSPATEL